MVFLVAVVGCVHLEDVAPVAGDASQTIPENVTFSTLALQSRLDVEAATIARARHALGATLVVVDVDTGGMLVADSRGIAGRRYLPSGTLRPLVLAAAIEDGADPALVYPAGDGVLELREGQFLWDPEPHHALTMREMVVRSAGLGPALIAHRRFPGGHLQNWMARFGVQGVSRTDAVAWTADRALVEATGSGTPVAPSAIARAYAILAHGGEDWDGGRIVSEGTAQVVVEMLDAAVNTADGTGFRARVPGLRVAGKTSCETNLEGGSYCSFVGMLPMPSPRVVLLVGIETHTRPEGREGYAQAAAPDFARLAPELLEMVEGR